MKKLKVILLSGLLALSFAGYSQAVPEICDNNIDDDGDGLIDCLDGDCNNIEKGCNCDDDIDNDGDGLIDQLDGDCAKFYGLEFVGEGSDCSIVPDVNGIFNMAPPIRSGQNTTDTQSKLAIGDVDGDGIPDVVFVSKWNQSIRVMATTDDQADGSDEGDIKSDYKTPGKNIFPKGKDYENGWYFEMEISIADIDGDGIGEIFAIASNRKNANDTPKWYVLTGFTYSSGSLVPLWDATVLGPDRPGEITLADFDGDGLVEIAFKDRIYAAETGELLADGNLGDWDTEVNSAPVAIDLFAGGNLELVTGNIVFNIPNLSRGITQVPTIGADMNTLGGDQWFPKEIFDANEYGFDNFSSTSVADMNNDGFLDVVLSGAIGNKNGHTAIFFWDVQNGTVDSFSANDASDLNGWKWGTGRPNLGEIDGDGKLEITFIAGNQLFAVEEVLGTLSEKWRRTINDSRSGIIATTVYDFDNDGNPEVVYRDSQQIAIIDGETGTNVKWATTCQSHTMMEGPIISDVNGDGNTDLCVPCNRSTSFDINDPIQQQALGEMRCYFSEGNAWLPTRKVWNQTGYYVVNVRDNLTIPHPQFSMTTVMGDGDCSNGLPGPQKPFNTFLNQVPFLGPNGCPVFPGPDLAFFGDDPDDPAIDKTDPSYLPAVEVTPPICGNVDVTVRFNIINSGSLPISDNIDVSFWDADPRIDAGANLLSTGLITVTALDVGETITTPGIAFDGPGSEFTLFIVLNDDGSTPPILDLTVNLNKECSIDNNVYDVLVTPTPFDITITSTDNFKCDNNAPDNGQLTANISVGGTPVVDLSNYSFQWYEGTDTNNPVAGPAGTQQTLSGVAEGDYGVIITDTDKGCTSDLIPGSLLRQGVDPDINFIVTDQVQCSPADGELQVVITGGDTGFTYQWQDDNGNDLGVTSSNLPGITEGSYTVIVSKDGCSKAVVAPPVAGPIEPDASVIPGEVTSCADLNSGTISAVGQEGGVPGADQSIYEFEWRYLTPNDVNNPFAGFTEGSILAPAHGTGATRTGLPVGYYGVYVTNTTTGCISIARYDTEVVNNTNNPIVQIVEVAPVTSCDPNQPNGILKADVIDGSGNVLDPTPYTFEWFEGDNTLPANAHTTTSGTNGQTAESVKGGGITYTVRATDGSNSCPTTSTIIISENIIEPVVTLTLVNSNTVCDPVLAASGTFTGSTSATVTFDGNTVTLPDPNYTFVWHDGPTTADPILAVGDNTDPLLDGLEDGEYTVVVTRNDLFCSSIPASIVVPADQVPPVLEETIIGATNCVAGVSDNGSATVLVNEGGPLVSTGYTFEWFVGLNPSGPVHSNVSGSEGQTAEGLAPNGNYTVLVTNIARGCSNSVTVFVPDDSVLPTVTLTSTANSICDVALTYNGTITAGVTDVNNPIGPAISDFTDYSFNWYLADGTTDVLTAIAGSSASDNVLSNIPGGTYEVTVTNTVLGCTSDPVQVFVSDEQILPVILITDTPSTNCDPALPNGELVAEVDVGGVPTTTGYTFTWYAGNTITPPIIGNNSLIQTLNGGLEYIVEVRNDATGCINTETIFLPDNSVKPSAALTPIPNSVCDITYGFTGGITAAVDDTNNGGAQAFPNAAYSFNWYLADGTTDVLTAIAGSSATDNVLSNVPGGDYVVTVTNTVLGCTSDPVNVTIVDQQLLPIINIADTPSTNCDPLLPDGSLTASVDETARPTPTNGYSFEWYNGATATGGVIGSAATLPNINGGSDYTVLVRNEDTGCESTQTFSLADNSILPALSLTPAPNSVCDITYGFTGGITAAVDDTNNGGAQAFPNAAYSFNWYLADGTTDVLTAIAGSSATDNVLSNVPGGDYVVTVTNTVLGCTSDPVNVTIVDQQLLPIINIADTPSTNCDPLLPDGSLTASVDETARPTPTNGYSFEWYNGATATGGVIGSAATLPNINGGLDYTVLVRNEDTGCESTQTFSLADNSILPALSLTPAPNSVCDITYGFTGGITAAVDDTNNGGAQAFPNAAYSFNWYLADGTTDVLTAIAGSSATDNVLSNVPGGDYVVTVTNTVLGCTSDPVNVTIVDQQLLPIINIADTPSTNCDPLLPDGSLTASVDETARPTPTNGYSFEWYNGATATGGVIGSAATLPNINGGLDYTVLVRNEDTGCESTQTFSLADNSILPALSLTPAPNSVCDITYGFTGGITAAVDDTNNGGAQAFPNAAYSFNWYLADGTTDVLTAIAGSSATDNVLSNVPGGDYVVTVTNTVLGCTSDPVNVTIVDQQLLPIINIADTPSTNCDPLLPDGSLTASVDETARPTPTNGYNFEWYNGATATGGVIGSAATLPNINGGLDYTVLVRNEDTGCESTQTFSLADNSILPALSLTPAPNSVCDISYGYTGGITAAVDDTNNGGVQAFPNAAYSFNWYLADGTTDVLTAIAGSSATDNVLSNVPGGDYVVTVTNTVLGCTSDPVNVTIVDQNLLPIINLADTPSTNCIPALVNGEITASIDETARPTPTNGYTYEWYIGNVVAGPIIGNAATLSSIQGGQDYIVQVKNEDTGCISTQSLTLGQNNSNPSIVLTAVPNSVCGGGTAQFNGSVEVGITDPAHPGGPAVDTPGEIADFTINWLNSASQDATTLPGASITGDGNILSFLEDDTYTVSVTNNLTGCTSPAVDIIVTQTIVLPAPTISIDQEQTSCDLANPNGGLTADADGLGGIADHTFSWFVGSDTSTPFVNGTDGTISGAAGETLSGLVKGDYTVVVRNTLSGCINQTSITLTETVVLPTVELVLMNPNTVCDTGIGYNGDIEVQVNGAIGTLPDANFELRWHAGETTGGALLATVDGSTLGSGIASLSSLGPGKYTVEVENLTSSCVSQPLTVEVTETLVPPTLTFTEKDQTSCVAGVFNGQVTVDAGGSAGPFTITLFSGNTTGGTQQGTISNATQLIVSSLPTDNYTALIYDEGTGCTVQATTTIAEIIEKPEVTLAITAPITDCTLDGEISPTITNIASLPAPAGFRYDWYAGPDASGAIYATTTGLDNADLNRVLSSPNINPDLVYSGYYTVIATDIDASCSSDPVTIFLPQPAPLLTLKFKVNFEPSDCNQNTGIVTGWIDADGDNDPYDPLEVADYTKYSYEWFEGNPTDPNSNYYTNPVPVFNPNTQLDVDVNDRYNSAPGGAGAQGVDYFDNNTVTDGATLFDVADGRYTFVVTDLANGCKEFIPLDIRFQDAQVTQLVTLEDVTSCLVDNGTIDVTVGNTDGFAQSDFEVQLYDGANVSGVPINTGTKGGYTSDFSVDEDRWNASRGVISGNNDGVLAVNDVLKFYANTTDNRHGLSKNVFIINNTYNISFDYFIPASNTSLDGFRIRSNGGGGLISDEFGVTGIWTSVNYNNIVAKGTAVLIEAVNGVDFTWPGAGDPTLDVIYFKNFLITDLSPPLFQNLPVGTYTIVSQQQFGSFCLSAPVTVVLDSAMRQPDLAAVVTPNTNCDNGVDPWVGNGEITVNPSKDGDDTATPLARTYSFAWTSADPINRPIVGGQETTNALTDLLPGDYTVVVTDDQTGCFITKPYTIQDQPNVPVSITPTALPNDQCGPFNGSLSIDDIDISPGTSSDYTYEVYFNGTDPGDLVPVVPVFNAGSVEFQDLEPGTYYIIAELANPAIPGYGCSSVPTLAEVVPDVSSDPNIVFSMTENMSCDIANPDGVLTATLDDPAKNYTYEWFVGTGTDTSDPNIRDFVDPADGSIAAATNVGSISNVVGATYTLRVTDPITFCTSVASFTVTENIEDPVITAHNKTDLTLCTPLDGSISITAISIGIPTDYDYTWYASLVDYNSGTSIPLESTESIGTLDFGSYYVVATKKPTALTGAGCETPPYNVIIQDTRVYPTPSLTGTANTSCDDAFPTGQIDVTVDAAGPIATSYDYVFFSGTELDGITPLGALPADELAGANIFTWTGVPDGIYTIDVTNNDTDCVTRGQVTVFDQPLLPSVVNFTPTDQTFCSPANGLIRISDNDIEIDGNGVAVSDLTLTLEDDLGNVAGVDFGVIDVQATYVEYQELAFGTYFVTVQRNGGAAVDGAGCSALPFRIDLTDDSVPPTTAATASNNTSCDPNFFTADITINYADQAGSAGDGSLYTIRWDAVPVGATIDGRTSVDVPFTQINVAGNTYTTPGTDNVAPGVYAYTILNETTGCDISGSVEVFDQPLLPSVVNFTPTDQTFCSPANGLIRISDNDIEIDGNGVAVSDLTLTLEDDLGNVAGVDFGVIDVQATYVEYQELAFGTYFVTVQRNGGAAVDGAGCSALPFRIDLTDDSVPPTTAATASNNTSCDPNFFTADITINYADQAGSAGDGSLYTIRWDAVPVGATIDGRTSVDVPFTQINVAGNTYTTPGTDNVAPGVYAYTILNETTGCDISGSVEVFDQPLLPSVVNFTPTDQTFCSPANGLIRISDNDIEIDGNGVAVSDLTLTLEDDLGNVAGVDFGVIDVQATYVEYQELAFGTYFVTVQRNGGVAIDGAGCSALPFRIDLTDDSVPPTTAATASNNTSCDPNFFTADITINYADQAGSAGDGSLYTIRWDAVPVGATIDGRTSVDVPFTQINVAGNTYTTPGTDNVAPGVYAYTILNETTGCDISGSVEVFDQPLLPSVVNFTPTDQTFCSPANGLIRISDNDIEIDGNGVAVSDLTLTLEDDLGNVAGVDFGVIDVQATYVEYQELAFGTYFVTVQRNGGAAVDGAGCSALPFRIDLTDDSVPPTTAATASNNTSCDPNFFTADITINYADQAGSAGDGSLYTIRWDAVPVGATIDGRTSVDVPFTQINVAGNTYTTPGTDNVAPGVYAYTILNETTGCDISGSVEVFDQPLLPSVVNFTPTDQTFCSPANGLIRISDNDIEIDGNGVAVSDLTLTLEDDLGNVAGVDFGVIDVQATYVEYQELAFGSYFVTVQRNGGAAIDGAGCSALPFRIDLTDERTYPISVLTSTSNSACDLAGTTGTITIATDLLGAATSYSYTWLSGVDPSNVAIPPADMPVDRPNVSNIEFWDNLLPGTYTVQILDDDSGCTTQGAVEVLDQPIVLDDITIRPTPVTTCDSNGAIRLYDNLDVVINTVPQALVDLTITLEDNLGNVLPNIPVAGTDGTGDYIEYQDLDFGTYFINITRLANSNTPGAGCTSPPVRVDLLDQRTFPTLDLTSTANTACDGTFDGTFTINISEVAGSVGDGATYTYDIDFEGNPFVDSNGNSGINNLFAAQDGTYSITILNEITQCTITGSITVEYRPQPIEILDVIFENQDICYPDGLIQVTGMDPANVADYTFQWYRTTFTPGSELLDAGSNPITTETLSTANYPSMGAGTYFVLATKVAGNNPGAGCPSAPVRVDIADVSVNPEVVIDFTSNTACEPQFSNGVITATVAETNGNTSDTYTFDWTFNGSAVLPATVVQTDNGNQSVITGAPDGDFVVRATNTSNTGCFVDSGITVTLEQPNSFPNIIDIDTIDPVNCNPTGTAEVTAVALGTSAPITDIPTLDTDYSYEWFINDTDPSNQILDGASNPITTRTLSDLLPGNYFVRVQSLLTGCKGLEKEFEITEDDIVYPVLTITQTVPQISCVVPFTGELTALADGSGAAPYTFTWYNTLDATGPSIGNANVLGSLGAGDFSVEVLNTITGCTSTALYIIEDQSLEFLPVITTSQIPRDDCLTADGTAIANFQTIQGYPFTYDYTFDWWAGTTPDFNTAPLVADNSNAAGLDIGSYTVRVTDNNTQCTETAIVEITDDRVDPVIEIVEENPLINCDPARPNGQLGVIIDNGSRPLSEFIIEWYAGTSATGTILSTSNKLIGQTAGTYFISVTDTRTNCTITDTGVITDGTLTPPTPDPIIVQHVTSCITPDGIIDVTVGGVTLGYDFTWYSSPDTNTPVLSSNNAVFDLDIGMYYVTATDIVTGCISEPAPIEVLDEREDPILDFVTKPSFCETATGFVEVKILNNNVIGQSFDWVNTDTGETASGPGWYDIFAGNYEVTVTSIQGCVSVATVELGTEIQGYQGVSANGDGNNDYFHIDCISNFPDNNVKIFNRVGILVYEADFYDNQSTIFEGIGLNGLYLVGEQVPDGTYFYIVDKRNGSKPITGYLELIR